MCTSMCTHISWCTSLPTEQFTRVHRHANISLCALECMCVKLNDRNSKWLTYQLHGPRMSARKAACGVCRRPNPMGEIQSQWYRTAFLIQPHIPLKSSVLQTLVSSQATKKVSVASADPEDCALSTFPQVLKASHQIPTLGSCLLSSWEVTALKKTNAMCMCV